MEKIKSAVMIYSLDIIGMFLVWGLLYFLDSESALTLDAKYGLLAQMVLLLWYLFLGLSLAAEYLLIQSSGICRYDICVAGSVAVILVALGFFFMSGHTGIYSEPAGHRTNMILVSCVMICCGELFGIMMRRKSIKDGLISDRQLSSKEI